MAASSEKREAFYHSPEWRKCQAAFKKEKHFTCEMCGKAGWLVHHKVPLDDENVDNPNIALGFIGLKDMEGQTFSIIKLSSIRTAMWLLRINKLQVLDTPPRLVLEKIGPIVSGAEPQKHTGQLFENFLRP